MKRLENLEDREINNEKDLVNLQIEIIEKIAHPLRALSEILVDQVIANSSLDAVGESRLFYIATEFSNRTYELNQSLDLAFQRAFELLSEATKK